MTDVCDGSSNSERNVALVATVRQSKDKLYESAQCLPANQSKIAHTFVLDAWGQRNDDVIIIILLHILMCVYVWMRVSISRTWLKCQRVQNCKTKRFKNWNCTYIFMTRCYDVRVNHQKSHLASQQRTRTRTYTSNPIHHWWWINCVMHFYCYYLSNWKQFSLRVSQMQKKMNSTKRIRMRFAVQHKDRENTHRTAHIVTYIVWERVWCVCVCVRNLRRNIFVASHARHQPSATTTFDVSRWRFSLRRIRKTRNDKCDCLPVAIAISCRHRWAAAHTQKK